jgi:hypothetical protein
MLREVKGIKVCFSVKGVAGSGRTARKKLEVLGKAMGCGVEEFYNVL